MMKEKPREIWGTINEPINASLSLLCLKGKPKKQWKDNECYNIIEWRHCVMSSTDKWAILNTTFTAKLPESEWSLNPLCSNDYIDSPDLARCAFMFATSGHKRMVGPMDGRMDGWNTGGPGHRCWKYGLLASHITPNLEYSCPSAEGTSPVARGAWEETGTNSKKYNL